MLTIEPLSDFIGARVTNVRLSEVPGPDLIEEIETALEKYGFLLFPNQEITPGEQVAFSAAFATLEMTGHIDARLQGYPEIFVVGNVDGRIVTFAPVEGSDDLEWHADHMQHEAPARASLLYCLEQPPVGGETLFACMYSAYDRLSEQERREAERLVGLTSGSGLRKFLETKAEKGAADKNYAHPYDLVVKWPLVRHHPRTGRKSLYFGSKVTIGIEGWPEEKAMEYIEKINRHATAKEFQYRHHWKPGDAVLWDNRRVLHAGTPYDMKAYQRRMHRTTFREDQPIA